MRPTLIVLVLGAATRLSAQQPAPPSPPRPDTGFAAMQRRGYHMMGVDQYTSTHVFDDLPTGGRITLQRDLADSAGAAKIRRHLRRIARAFRSGDFTAPEFVHSDTVPGTSVMAARRALISYAVTDLPHGAQLAMTTADLAALAAIHEFLAYQRRAHHAGGMTH